MAPLVVRPRAHTEIRAAFDRYLTESSGAAEGFLVEVRHALDRIAENPERFRLLRRRLRRVLMVEYPYGVYYRILPDKISVVGVIHLRRDPKQWLMREAPGITVCA